MIKGGLTPILSFLRKHGFVCGIAVQIFVASSIALSGSLSFGLWHREVIDCIQSRASSASKALSTLIRFQTKTELFCSVFKKICVHTYRFRIVFARLHYNAVSVWKRCYTRSVHGEMNSTHAHFNISAREIGAKLKLHGSACPPFWILTVEWFWWRHRFHRPH